MNNIPGIISIGYAPASDFIFTQNYKASDKVTVNASAFAFFDIVPQSGDASNQQKKSAAGKYFDTEVNFKLSPVDTDLIEILESFTQPHLFYLKTVSGNYMLGLTIEVFPEFVYETINEKSTTGFIGANCKLTMKSLMGLLEIA